jgi:hypothetical protein
MTRCVPHDTTAATNDFCRSDLKKARRAKSISIKFCGEIKTGKYLPLSSSRTATGYRSPMVRIINGEVVRDDDACLAKPTAMANVNLQNTGIVCFIGYRVSTSKVESWCL